MLGLVNYGSSDEDGGSGVEEPQPRQAAKPQAPANNGSRKRAKRVLKLAAMLPPDIRRLLESGGVDDEDDDQWSASKSAAASREEKAASAKKRRDEQSRQPQHALFALLPKPVANSGDLAPPRQATAPVDRGECAEADVAGGPLKDVPPPPPAVESDGSNSDETSEDEPPRPSSPKGFFGLVLPEAGSVVPDASGAAATGASIYASLPSVSSSSNPQFRPDPWQQARDEASGELYYFNAETNKTTWERPADFGGGLDYSARGLAADAHRRGNSSDSAPSAMPDHLPNYEQQVKSS